MQQNEYQYLVAKFGVDTAENEPLQVWGVIQFNIQFGPERPPACGAGRLRDAQLEIDALWNGLQKPAKEHPEGEMRNAGEAAASPVRSEMNIELNHPPNLERLVLGCIDAEFCN